MVIFDFQDLVPIDYFSFILIMIDIILYVHAIILIQLILSSKRTLDYYLMFINLNNFIRLLLRKIT